MTSKLRRFFDRDVFDEPIDPNKTYHVVYKVRPTDRSGGLLVSECVSGEELLACAEWIDQQATKENDDG